MKHSYFFCGIAILVAVSCSSPAVNGPAHEILSPKAYSAVVQNYESCEDFIDGIAIVRKDYDEYGAINKKGEEILPCEHYELINGHEGMIIVETKEQKYGVYNQKGKLIVPATYDDITNYSEGIARVRGGSLFNGKYGYINKKGKEVIPIQYNNADESFSEGLAAAAASDGYGYINTKGEWVTSTGYSQAKPFSEGLAVVRKNYRYHVIDKKDVILFSFPETIEPQGRFHEGMLLVYDDDKELFGYYNNKGQLVIPCEYNYADGFRGGKALTLKLKGDKPTICFIDKKGTVKEVVQSPADIKGYKAVDEELDSVTDVLEALSELSSIKESFDKFFNDDDDDEDDE